jgi:hypothetical protein
MRAGVATSLPKNSEKVLKIIETGPRNHEKCFLGVKKVVAVVVGSVWIIHGLHVFQL